MIKIIKEIAEIEFKEEDHWIGHVDFCAFFWAYLVVGIIKNSEKIMKKI
jgi:hypothetical protein